ncbi:hypothetical protein LSH36_758g01069 [Paralvinella palmiformis]|uniref:G-protein coupled receptors family 2 profile 2 domain-containing protein n=1 Tax=Paralvinella palmiformis TaxID=53620 RepID=A0AAD9MSR4_9ANNE|nr:hypothetical protein LSH36_758g01069 [Paralvinella palmiformis]
MIRPLAPTLMTLMFGLNQVISSSVDGAYCRDSWVEQMAYEDFAVYTCSKCFVQVFWDEKDLTLKVPPTYPYLLVDPGNGTEYYPDAESDTSVVCTEKLTSAECRMWRHCCQAAKHCCRDTQQRHLSPQVYRECNHDSTWHVNPMTNQEYSDYDECFSQEKNILVLKISLYIDFVGNGISILSLIVAILIITTIRNLRSELQQRAALKIHFNLFVSVLFTATFTVAFHFVYHDAFTSSNPVYQQNTVWCRALHITTKYFKSTTYMAMFCEGLFLYRRISQVMQIRVSESLVKYLIITWVLPVTANGVYVIARLTTGQNERHAIIATMSLIPVFGIQFLFLIYRPRYWPPYEIIVAIFESSQGTLVAVLYCFTTKEVKTELGSILQGGTERADVIEEKELYLETSTNRRDSCSSRTTQRSYADSSISSIVSQHKLELRKNGLVRTMAHNLDTSPETAELIPLDSGSRGDQDRTDELDLETTEE